MVSIYLYNSVLLLRLAFCFAYSNIESYIIVERATITASVTSMGYIVVDSMVECSLVCSFNLECCTANYDKKTHICQMDSNCCPDYQTTNTNEKIAMHRRPEKDQPVPGKPRDCSDLPEGSPSGVYTIYPDLMNGFDVYCEDGFTVFQRRNNGKLNFYRPWTDYKAGFGNVISDHWLGNDKLHILSNNNKRCGKVLKIVLTSFNDEIAYILYRIFHVKDEMSKYKLFVQGCRGTGGDSLYEQNGCQFSTPDQDNDNWDGNSCAISRRSGFWFNKCGLASLNGIIQKGLHAWSSMYWYSFTSADSLKTSMMMLK